MINHSCLSHLKNFKPKRERLKKKLAHGHPIHTLMLEHEVILSFLDKLKKTNQKIQKMKNYKKEDKSFEVLKDIAEHLIEAEPHHQREEEVLFPEIETRGVFAPPKVMREEHKILRKLKKDTKSLLIKIGKINFSQFKKELTKIINLLALTLKDHIAKEDDILYPLSLEIIKEKEIWAKIKKECDKIGYCCFTPGNSA